MDITDCCLAESQGIEVVFSESLMVDLGNDTIICDEVNLTLDAGNPGSNYQWSTGATSQIININVNTAGIISVTVTDQNGCSSSDELTISTPIDTPQAVDLLEHCSETGCNYIVSFEIAGGDPNTYEITGDAGTLNGTTFTSDPIPFGTGYSFFLSDGLGCVPVEISGTPDCPCTTSAGSLDPTPFRICGDEVATLIFDQIVAGSEDIIEFILYDGSLINIDSILLIQDNPDFNFSAALSYETTYYLAIRVGNDNGNGQVDTTDCCLAVSAGTPITFYENVVAEIISLSGTAITCNEPSLILSGTSSQPSGNLIFNWSAFNGGNIFLLPMNQL